MSKELKTILKEKLKERKVKIPKLSEITGIPKDRIYAWYRDNTNPKAEDQVIITKWINGEIFNSPQGFTPLTTKVSMDVDALLQIVKDANEKVTKTLEEHNHFLQRIVEANLGKLDRIEQLSAVSLAELKGALKYQAEKEAKGDKKQQEKIESHVSKLAGEALKTILPSGSGLIPHK